MLAADAGLSAGIFENLRAAMRDKLLVYGDRPIGVALRPHFLERKQFDLLAKRAELVASALERVAAAAVESPAVMDEIGLTPLEAKLALIDPGFSGSAITSRMDGFVHGNQIKFVEYNAENPSSLSDQEGLNRLLFAIAEMSPFAQRHRLRQFSPVERLLEALLATYREWGGREVPRVAIIDWDDVPTANEFVLLQDYFLSQGDGRSSVRRRISATRTARYAATISRSILFMNESSSTNCSHAMTRRTRSCALMSAETFVW